MINDGTQIKVGKVTQLSERTWMFLWFMQKGFSSFLLWGSVYSMFKFWERALSVCIAFSCDVSVVCVCVYSVVKYKNRHCFSLSATSCELITCAVSKKALYSSHVSHTTSYIHANWAFKTDQTRKYVPVHQHTDPFRCFTVTSSSCVKLGHKVDCIFVLACGPSAKVFAQRGLCSLTGTGVLSGTTSFAYVNQAEIIPALREMWVVQKSGRGRDCSRTEEMKASLSWVKGFFRNKTYLAWHPWSLYEAFLDWMLDVFGSGLKSIGIKWTRSEKNWCLISTSNLSSY